LCNANIRVLVGREPDLHQSRHCRIREHINDLIAIHRMVKLRDRKGKVQPTKFNGHTAKATTEIPHRVITSQFGRGTFRVRLLGFPDHRAS
jgi:hypothetical protein